jgi:hypothetical protein
VDRVAQRHCTRRRRLDGELIAVRAMDYKNNDHSQKCERGHPRIECGAGFLRDTL